MKIYPFRSKHVACGLSITVLLVGVLFVSACTRSQELPQLPTATRFVMPATWTPTVTATPAPTFTLVVTGKPLPTQPPAIVDLQVSSYTTYRSGTSLLYVAGVAVNRGTIEAGEARVAVSLLDTQGNVLAATSMNLTPMWYVPPDGKYPFLVAIAAAPKEWKEVKIQFETKPYKPSQLNKPYWDLKIDKVVGKPPPGGAYPNYGYAGRVTNTGNQRARMVQVVAIAYDASGKVLDVEGRYIEFEFLNPGQDAPFELFFKNLKTAPARYELLAEGHLPN